MFLSCKCRGEGRSTWECSVHILLTSLNRLGLECICKAHWLCAMQHCSGFAGRVRTTILQAAQFQVLLLLWAEYVLFKLYWILSHFLIRKIQDHRCFRNCRLCFINLGTVFQKISDLLFLDHDLQHFIIFPLINFQKL